MENKYNEAVSTALGRSRRALAFVALAAPAAAVPILASSMAVGPRVLLATWIACTAIHAIDRLRRPRRLEVRVEGVAIVDGRDGRLVDGCFVAPWLTVVRWRPAGAWLDRTVLVLPDMLPPEDFRRLRVLLKWWR